MTTSPSVSVILVSPDRYDTIKKTVAHLRRQTICNEIELVFVFPEASTFLPDSADLSEFHSIILVENPVVAVGAAYVAGIRRATAPLVALTEDHSYPQPNWAESLAKAHNQDRAAVGPAILNANPYSAVSKADLLCAYGPWLHPAQEGPARHLPGHNSSYKKNILMSYGERLEEMMEAESVLHWDLVRRGFRLWLEPKAVTAHTNFERWASWIPVQYHSGRVFAATRASSENWPFLRRMAYVAAWPLIPCVRFGRILKELMQPGRRITDSMVAFPALLIGLIVNAAGESVGYALGAGASLDRMVYFEFHRESHRNAARISA